MSIQRLAPLLVFGLVLFPRANQAQAPKVKELRVQKVDGTTYFHVSLPTPDDMRPLLEQVRYSGRRLAYQPRLVPQDEKTSAVYSRWNVDHDDFHPFVEDLEFVGKVHGEGTAKLRLLYPKRLPAADPKQTLSLTQVLENHASWAEETITLDFARAVKIEARKAKLPAQLQLNVPEVKAKVWIDGQLKQIEGVHRTYDTVPLEPGEVHVYHLKVVWKDNGKEMTAERRVRVIPGTTLRVNLGAAPYYVGSNSWQTESYSPFIETWQAGDGPWRPIKNNLARMWAAGQMYHFALLEAQTPQSGFYSFACETTGLKHGVALTSGSRTRNYYWGDPTFEQQLYQVAGDADDLIGPMSVYRLREGGLNPKTDVRSVDISKVPGIDAPAHPWDKKLAGAKPDIEPFARMVPHDNYFIHFKNLAKLTEAGDLIEQWSGGLTWFLDNSTKGYLFKERVEQQLCFKLGDKLTSALVKNVAVTGSDPYLREGSDLTLLLKVANPDLFQAAQRAALEEIVKTFAGKLTEDTTAYQQIAIHSLVSPLREISLYRAVVDDLLVLSNSPVGIRRIIDAHKGKITSLAEARDFQYLRTVFRLDNPREDGLVYLSDAFIRNLVGPAVRIKERRRLEALTSLAMVNNAALFTAWETGKLPASHKDLLEYTGLKDTQISTQGESAQWDPVTRQAVSPLYNTRTFATPLIELPIDKITPAEQAEYERFRQGYANSWRQYFDPMGFRIRLTDTQISDAGEKTPGEVRIESFVMPLVENSRFSELRRLTGDGAIKIDPAMFSGKTLLQFVAHLSPNARERKDLGDVFRQQGLPELNWLGKWFTVRVDDSPIFLKMVENRIMMEVDPHSTTANTDVDDFAHLPITLGVDLSNSLVFAAVLAGVKKMIPAKSEWEVMKEPYKDVKIVEIKLRDTFIRANLYYVLLEGAWYISLQKECIHDLIDAALARKKDGKSVEANAVLYASSKAAVHTRDALLLSLEWEANRQAVATDSLLHVLYRGGLLTAKDDEAMVGRLAWKYLGLTAGNHGFADYVFDPARDEVVNKRYGTVRQVQLPKADPGASPLGRLLEDFDSVRADVRFRDDGMSTVVRFRRKN